MKIIIIASNSQTIDRIIELDRTKMQYVIAIKKEIG